MANERYYWSCGHEASAVCAECNAILIRKANTFVEIIDALLDRLDVNDSVAVEQRRLLTSTLNQPISHGVDTKGPTDDDRA